MFGRRKREEAAAAEAAREAERHALFARLAERPEHVCPFLGLEGDRTGYVEGVSDEHRCFAFGDPATISAEQQTRVCQERGYGNCPRYLRGVLVIPTEELEALRRPRAPMDLPPATLPAPVVERRRRATPIFLLVAVLLLLAGGAAAFLLLGDGNGVGSASPTPTMTGQPSSAATLDPTPSVSDVQASPSPSPVAEPSLEPTPVALPSAGEEIPTLPTPAPDAELTGYIIAVTEGQFPVVRINSDGTVGEETTTVFSRVSGAPVARLEIDGTTYWMTLAGLYTRLAYVDGFSGAREDFQIFESYENPDGSSGFLEVLGADR